MPRRDCSFLMPVTFINSSKVSSSISNVILMRQK
jgi:hypothetical protein